MYEIEAWAHVPMRQLEQMRRTKLGLSTGEENASEYMHNARMQGEETKKRKRCRVGRGKLQRSIVLSQADETAALQQKAELQRGAEKTRRQE
jgi:hypothetical protein